MEIFLQADTWVALLTLTFLEVVLGIDNIIFISIVANKLPADQRKKARTIGFILALILRVAMLFGISFLLALKEPLFEVHWSFFSGGFSGQSLILLAGGIFLLYKSTREIFQKTEGHQQEETADATGAPDKKKIRKNIAGVIVQIALIDLVFSVDSILTAMGLVESVILMITAVVIAIAIMMAFAGPVGRFVNKHPSIQVLALAFLLMIGFMLIMEALHLAEVVVAGTTIGTIPKGYLYTAILFSFSVELLNMRISRKRSAKH